MIDTTKFKLSICVKINECVYRNRNEEVYRSGSSKVEGRFTRSGRKMTIARARKYDRKVAKKKRIWIEERPVSFGDFTIDQIKEIIADVEMFPFKEEHTYFWKKGCVYKVRLVPVEEPDETDTDKS